MFIRSVYPPTVIAFQACAGSSISSVSGSAIRSIVISFGALPADTTNSLGGTRSPTSVTPAASWSIAALQVVGRLPVLSSLVTARQNTLRRSGRSVSGNATACFVYAPYKRSSVGSNPSGGSIFTDSRRWLSDGTSTPSRCGAKSPKRASPAMLVPWPCGESATPHSAFTADISASASVGSIRIWARFTPVSRRQTAGTSMPGHSVRSDSSSQTSRCSSRSISSRKKAGLSFALRSSTMERRANSINSIVALSASTASTTCSGKYRRCSRSAVRAPSLAINCSSSSSNAGTHQTSHHICRPGGGSLDGSSVQNVSRRAARMDSMGSTKSLRCGLPPGVSSPC